MKYGERLRLARKNAGFSQDGLADKSGVKQGSISKIERGGQESSAFDVELAHALGVSSMWLRTGDAKFAPDWLAGTEITKIEPSNFELGPDIRGRVPLINWSQAGYWGTAGDFHLDDAEEWRETTAKVGKCAYALRVKGDSMFNPSGHPSIPEGVIVIVDPDTAYSSGSIVIARLENVREATIKKLVEDAGRRYLKPLNPAYQAIEINDDCTICGVVRQVVFDL